MAHLHRWWILFLQDSRVLWLIPVKCRSHEANLHHVSGTQLTFCKSNDARTSCLCINSWHCVCMLATSTDYVFLLSCDEATMHFIPAHLPRWLWAVPGKRMKAVEFNYLLWYWLKKPAMMMLPEYDSAETTSCAPVRLKSCERSGQSAALMMPDHMEHSFPYLSTSSFFPTSPGWRVR